MIRSFKHKGQAAFFDTGSKKGIKPENASKIARILDRLDASTRPSDMDLPGYGLHQLFGDRAGQWAVIVSGNWRITFRFENEEIIQVDLIDYH